MIRHSGINDSGANFQIIASTRRVAVPVQNKVIGTVGDHYSEQLTFQCPRDIDGHDVKNCAEHYVTWKNPNGEIGHDHLALIDETDEYLLYTWDIRGNTTVKAGVVSFSIHFEDVSESGIINYRWSTAPCMECEILDSVNAAIGAYELIYVDVDALVFADQTPVRDGTILLETNGIIPDGRKFIDSNGVHDVAEFASVDVKVNISGQTTVDTNGIHDVSAFETAEVKVPSVIEVFENGFIKATGKRADNAYNTEDYTTHQLSKDDDPNFIADNIREGKTIFGVKGKYAGVKAKMVHVKLTLMDTYRPTGGLYGSTLMTYQVLDDAGYVKTMFLDIPNATGNPNGSTVEFDALAGSMLGIGIGEGFFLMFDPPYSIANTFVLRPNGAGKGETNLVEIPTNVDTLDVKAFIFNYVE